MRWAFGVAASLLALPAWAEDPWRVTLESPAEVVAVDLSSIQRDASRVTFRERHALRGGQTDPISQRPLREILLKRVIDCRGRRTATLSRAVFDANDALIEHHAVHARHATWRPIAADDPQYRLTCGGS